MSIVSTCMHAQQAVAVDAPIASLFTSYAIGGALLSSGVGR